MNITISSLLDLEKTIAAELFDGLTYPHEVLEHISAFILKLGETLPAEEYDHPEEGIWIAKDAKVFPSAYIGAPCIIDHGAEVTKRRGQVLGMNPSEKKSGYTTLEARVSAEARSSVKAQS